MNPEPPTEYEIALADALADPNAPNRVLMNLTCHLCKRTRSLATVSRTRRGLLFHADVLAFDVWPQLGERGQSRFEGTPAKGPVYKVDVLIDWPGPQPYPEDAQPRVSCDRDGLFLLSPSRLAVEARRVTRLGRSWSIQPFIVSTE